MRKLAFITALFLVTFATNAGTNNLTGLLKVEKHETAYALGKVSPFCMAIVKGEFETVKKLVDMGADVNEKSNGLTPLMYAAKFNRVDILKFLIDKGADLKARNSKNGFTALRYAELSNATEAHSILENALGT